MTREDVISNLAILRTWCAVNPNYGIGLSIVDCLKVVTWLDDAITLLKAQEPRDAIVVPNGIDKSGGWWFQCPSCKMEIEPRDRYCRSCGQAVKWE